MKKFVLIMLAFMASFSVYAQEVTTNVEEEVAASSAPILIATIQLDATYIATNPVTITAPIPVTQEEVIYISGPCMPTIPSQYWSIINGTLTITYPSGDLTETSRFPELYNTITIYGHSSIYYIQLIF